MTDPMTTTPSTGDGLIERACVAFIGQIETEMRAMPEMFGPLSDERYGFYDERISEEQRNAVRRAMTAALTSQADTIQTLQTEREAFLSVFKVAAPTAEMKKAGWEALRANAHRTPHERMGKAFIAMQVAALSSNPNTAKDGR